MVQAQERMGSRCRAFGIDHSWKMRAIPGGRCPDVKHEDPLPAIVELAMHSCLSCRKHTFS